MITEDDGWDQVSLNDDRDRAGSVDSRDEPLLQRSIRSQFTNEERRHRGRLFADFQNVLKAFIGANYLSMPFAFSEAGFILAVAGLIAVAIITDRCCCYIISCKQRAVARICKRLDFSSSEFHRRLTERITYGDVGREAAGPWVAVAVDSALVVTQFGFCVSYVIFMINASQELLPRVNPYLLVIGPCCVLLVLALMPDVRALTPMSFVANFAIFLGFVSILGWELSSPKLLDHLDSVVLVRWSNFPIFFGITMSAFEGIGTVLPIEASMQSARTNFPWLLHLAIGTTTVVLGIFGTIGMLNPLADDDEVPQIATALLPDASRVSKVVWGCLFLAILFTYPLQIFPVIQVAEWYILGSGCGDAKRSFLSVSAGTWSSSHGSSHGPQRFGPDGDMNDSAHAGDKTQPASRTGSTASTRHSEPILGGSAIDDMREANHRGSGAVLSELSDEELVTMALCGLSRADMTQVATSRQFQTPQDYSTSPVAQSPMHIPPMRKSDGMLEQVSTPVPECA